MSTGFPTTHQTYDMSPIVPPSPSNRRGGRFWMVIVCIMLSQFLIMFELAAVSPALPTIVNELNGEQFVWIGSAYSICSTALVPLSGGIAEIFGRKVTMFIALVVFAFGSIVAGAAKDLNFLIAGRAIQGSGAGSVAALCHIILCDLVSLKERGSYNGLIAVSYTMASGIGPVVGGILAQHGQWRWIFYINAPICALTAILVPFSLKVRTPPGSFTEKLKKIDWFGNVLVMAATTSVMIGLTWGGVQFPWNSKQVLVPLILGLIGLALFLVYEATVPRNPLIPFSLMSTRTALSGYVQSLLLFTVFICMIYYLMVYFQACKNASPTGSGVDGLGLSLTVAPFAIIGGVSVTTTRKYRPQIWVSWSFILIGVALLTTIDATSPTSRIRAIGFELIAGSGVGMLTAALFFPFLAANPIERSAHAISLFMFIRNFANILGVTIGGAILQNELSHRLPADFLAKFPGGTEIAYSVIPLIRTLPQPLREQTQVAFADSLRVVWQVMTGLSAAGLLSSLAMKGLKLHTEVDEKWGLDETRKDNGALEMGTPVVHKTSNESS